ncbi:hypothetical protein [Variovorax sp. J31P207]|uniref:hypothetical protein n=1 Tax=Variovorax sp. J31P207 TaxID=3053510 RepID=UPI0025753376|nr:hypothetical protein [Variovorax sp. J31P207]MDM0069649.1 hypothetical protein [Variovorax sp. J31P207]
MPSKPRDWPFDSPPNVTCLTVRSIVEGVKPVLMASRDATDGGWQFLTGDAFDAADEMLVSLASIVDRDPTLLQLADVQPGWMAWREHRQAPWNRQAEAQQTEE